MDDLDQAAETSEEVSQAHLKTNNVDESYVNKLLYVRAGKAILAARSMDCLDRAINVGECRTEVKYNLKYFELTMSQTRPIYVHTL